MIYVIMHGRLGNQMFQYAFAKKMQQRRNDKISVYFGRVKKKNNSDGWGDDLKYFNVGEYKIEENLQFMFYKMSFRQKIALANYIYHCKRFRDPEALMEYQCMMQEKLNPLGLYWIRNGYFEPQLSKEKNIFICGHFEHYAFYTEMDDALRQIFTPQMKLMDKNKKLLELIKGNESVCISIRRGDYLSDDNKNTYYICDKAYFDKAIDIIKKYVPNAVLVFFSDDVDWIKNNCHYEGSIYFETEDNPTWEKIRLMSACKHFIISNSTFSWWVQKLSANDSKIVVSPNRWKNGSKYKGLIDPSFITVDV